jgi:asparagine synthase (glutamine-hydrolysing)
LELPEVSRRGNLQAAYNYLVFNRTDADTQTFFEDILQFPPGATARIDLGNLATGLQIQRYWDPSCSINRPCSDERCGSAEQLRELLLQSVKLHLRSDVEVGAALSGGVDSSGLVAGIREIGGPALAIKAFCFAAGECGDDESGWARLAAAEADADLTTIPASPDRFIADLDAVIRSQGEPFGSTSIHAQYSVMRAAAEKGVKVMIDGQGADELFAGYRPFLSAMIAEMLADARGLSAWQLANDVADGRKSAFMFLMQAVVKSLPQFIGRYLRPFGAVPLKPGWINIDYLAQHSVVFEPPTRRFADDELVADLAEHVVAKTLPALLRFEDRNSMAFSIESRVPFLTTAIADFAYSLASNKLISSKGGYKTILREALRGLVPDAILDRRDKVGFAAPQKHWLMQADDWIASVLSETAFSRVPLLDQRQTVDVVRRGISSGDDSLAWRCLNLLRWSVIYNVRYPK